MYPDLSYFFNDIFNTSVDNWTSIFKTFGFMLVIALLACGVLLKSELKRLESLGLISGETKLVTFHNKASNIDILTNTLFLFFMGAKIPYIVANFEKFQSDPAGTIFSKLGNWPIGLLVGLLTLAYYLYSNHSQKGAVTTKEMKIYPSSKTDTIIIIAGITGVLGSRLFSITEDMKGFMQDPLGSLLAGSGLNVYGGIILAFVAVYWYVKRIGIKPIYMMDIGGIGILLGYAIGRIGCQLSGDGDWGIVAADMPSWWFLPDWLWSYNYPNNVNNDGVLLAQCDQTLFDSARAARQSIENACQTACGMRYCHELKPGVYPTPIYETIFGLLAAGVLYMKRASFKIPGTIFFIYMIINGLERFFIEFIRVNEKYKLFGLEWSQAQYISIIFIVIGIIGLWYLYARKQSTLQN